MSQVIVILDSNTLSVVDWYFADSPIVPVTPGIRLEVPEGLTVTTLMAVRDADGTVTLQEDPDKLAARTAQAWTALRTERNARLAASDYTQLQDAHLSAEKKSAWADYRQALRDLPENATDPTQVTWPVSPSQ
jgi:hypothetical protein